MEAKKLTLKRSIRNWIVLFIISLVLSGITAFPVETELAWLLQHVHNFPPILQEWLRNTFLAVADTNRSYPWLSYGTDWLAFAHLVIAVSFIGPLRDPVRNVWVVEFGIIACLMVFPLAFICGSIRGIPLFWQLIDCSFGIIGLIPLYICRRKIKKLELLEANLGITSK